MRLSIDNVFCIKLMLKKSNFHNKASESTVTINLENLPELCLPHQLKNCLVKQRASLVLDATAGQDTSGCPT